MAQFTYSEYLEASGGRALTDPASFLSARLWTDTRTLQPGDFFLPLSGARFDGHDYLAQAFVDGAVGAFVSQDQAAAHPEWQKLPNLIAVDDPLKAYLAMARLHRVKINPKVIAVTGSSGKTTTKEMLAAAFGPLKKTAWTEKNFNNEVGVCQTLLALAPGTEIAVVEMGMRALREIAVLSEAACPDIALIVSVGPAHIEFLGSLEAIARAKLEIAEGMDPAGGVLVFNGDSPHLAELAPTLWPGRQVVYHLSEAEEIECFADADAEGVRFAYHGVTVTLSVPGEHMVANALGVLKVGEALGFALEPLAAGLSTFRPEKGRWERKALAGFANVWVIDDAYNANPDSMRASLQAFLATAPTDLQRVLLLSGMKELGGHSRHYHEELGRWLAVQKGIDRLVAVGDEARWLTAAAQGAPYPAHHAETLEEAAALLTQPSGALSDAILYLKGSRFYKLDTLPELIAAHTEAVS